MSEFSKELKSFAENGLRSAPGWLTVGRQVESGSKPRTTVAHLGADVQLFTRDQTQRRPRLRIQSQENAT